MEDPRLKPVPDGATASEKAEILALDLAYGAEVEDWDSTFNVHLENIYNHHTNDYEGDEIRRKLEDYFETKWENNQPGIYNMGAYGFLELTVDEYYQLTDKARALLKSPAVIPDIFISYRRAESSAFALLIEARFKNVDNYNVFVDKNLKGGEKWHARLEDEVKRCRYFVCLLGPTTLESDYVRKEIEWADKHNCLIIPVCHNGYTLDVAGSTMPQLGIGHGYEIKGDPTKAAASDYEAAANFVLNSCGYATY